MSKVFSKQTSIVFSLVLLGLSAGPAAAVPVTIRGFVADLTGIPHDRPNITVEVRSVGSNQVIRSQPVNPETGEFNIEIDPADVPDTDVRLTIRAFGTAFINGQEVAVATDANLFGLAGEIAAGLASRMPDSEQQVTQFIILVVPKAKPPAKCCTSNCRSHRRLCCRARRFRCR